MMGATGGGVWTSRGGVSSVTEMTGPSEAFGAQAREAWALAEGIGR